MMDIERGTEKDQLRSLRRKAADLNRKGSWGEEAIELNTIIIELDPDDPAACSRRGRCYWTRRNLEWAEADYRQALYLMPEGSSTVPMIRQAIRDIEDEARRLAEQECSRREELEKRQRERAAELDRQKNLLAALRNSHDAVDLARDARSGSSPDPEFAYKAYRRALEIAPNRLEVAVEWAGLLRANLNGERALKIYDRILQLRPNDRAARVGKAAIMVDVGEADEALRISDEILSEHPQDSYARRVKARAHAVRGEIPEAVWHFESSEDF